MRFDAGGKVRVGGQTVCTIPTERWVHIEIEARVGKESPRTFRLTVVAADEKAQVFDNLAMLGEQFSELHWLGFSSTAKEDTAFFVDNLRIQTVSAQ